ncbi:MAG: hypothetical protein ACXVIZ_09845 [Halobacteriota archaeon]
MVSFDQQGFSVEGKKCKPECKLPPEGQHNGISNLELPFTHEDLNEYLTFRSVGLVHKSATWHKKSAELLWNATHGLMSVSTLRCLRDSTLTKYRDWDAKCKVLNFAKAFLNYLATTHFDPRYHAFALFLELPKALKERKRVTGRIVTTEDIRCVLSAIKEDYKAGKLNERQYRDFTSLVLFGAFTGQRPYATIRKLTVGQFRSALNETPPVVEVLAEQDKIRMQHYCPLHPQVVDAVSLLLDKRTDDKAMFTHEAFDDWLRGRKVPLSRVNAHFVCSDLRKFAEQYGDIIGWDQSNRAYILTHNVSGVDLSHYKHPLPEHVYDVYMKYWANVTFSTTI